MSDKINLGNLTPAQATDLLTEETKKVLKFEKYYGGVKQVFGNVTVDLRTLRSSKAYIFYKNGWGINPNAPKQKEEKPVKGAK